MMLRPRNEFELLDVGYNSAFYSYLFQISFPLLKVTINKQSNCIQSHCIFNIR